MGIAGIASSLKGTDDRVLNIYKDKAKRWSAAIQERDLEITAHRKGKEPTRIVSKPDMLTKHPQDAMRDVDIVVFVLPVDTHLLYLEALKPYIEPGIVIVGLPGVPGFGFQVSHLLDDTGRQCTIMNFKSLPWACRITEYGVKCEVLGTKKTGETCR